MPQQKQKAPKGSSAPKPSDQISDPRFTNIQTDPRFRLPSKRNTHVQIDKRFAHMLSDDGFASSAKVDRYGRKLPKSKGRRDLERFYRIEGEEEKEGEGKGIDDDEDVQKELRRLDAGLSEEDWEEDSSEDSESSSDGEHDEDGEGLDIDGGEEVFGMLEEQGEDGEGIPKGEMSSRLAVVNLDWDHIRAADLMAVFSSFVPGGGRIENVAVFPSQFGRERMEREEVEGPPREIFASRRKSERNEAEDDEDDEDEPSDESPEDDGDEDDEDIKKSILKEDAGLEFNSAKLRRYQLERLRYFYAVLTCSSTGVAQAIYDAVDGTEYLTTANFFDLRYIPDDTSFEEDKPRDECDRIPDNYRPNEFVTDALQHSKVRLTWDADDTARKETQKRAFGGSRKDVDENDLRAYLGSDSSEEDDGGDGPEPLVVDATATTATSNEDSISANRPTKKVSKKEAERQRMRTLLGLSAEPAPRKPKADKDAGPVGDMQVTFTSGLSTSNGKKASVFENEPEREETTVEKYVRREKERKARRKEKLKKKTAGEGAENEEADADEEMGVREPGAAAEGDGGKNDGKGEDLGFDDAFFSAPSSAAPASAKPSTKASKRAKRAAEEAAASSLERTNLQSITSPPNPNEPDEIHHFDINALARAEKITAKSRRKKQKLSARDKEALEAKENDKFNMDVADERFRDVFERAEFAIEPGHPRFRGTEGMRRLVEEGRRKKRGRDGEEGGDGGEE